MIRLGKFVVQALLLALCLFTAAPALAADFNSDWKFFRVEGSTPPPLETAPWETVTLPHTTRIEPRIVNDQWQGTAFYRKTFATLPAWRGQRVMLRFEAAMNVATVSLNGQQLIHHLGGYLPFTVDMTPHLKPSGDNVLTVELDNRDNAITGPKPLKILDFNTYGGLYRGVRLIVKPSVHVTDEMMANTVAGGGVFVTYPTVNAREAQVAVKTQVANTSAEDRVVTVAQTLRHGSYKSAATLRLSLRAGETRDVEQVLQVWRPRLWSPKSPNLYTLETQVLDGKAIDTVQTRIGIRRLEITKDTFKINGEAHRLRGVNRHQEYPYVGYATSPQADYRDARLIKAAGFDFVRLSHYPQSRAFMDAADELGLVLLDSVPGWQFHNPDPAFAAQVLQTCRDMIRRDRNHPSVVAWECSLNETGMPPAMVESLTRAVHEEYPGNQAWSAGWMPEGFDIFIDARQHRMKTPWVKKDRPYIVSEYGDWEYYAQNAGFNQDSWADLKQDDRTSRQTLGSGEKRLLQQATNIQEAHNDNYTTPAFADAYWVMFDYNRGYADDLEASGTMSLERSPKFSYHFFRSQRDAREVSPMWGGGPMVFIASFWNADSSPKVRVFSNAQEVELFLNGKSVGRRKPDADAISNNLPHPPFTFDLGAFTPGKLEARAYIDGRVVTRHAVETADTPKMLKVEIDTAGVKAAPGDLVFARAHLLDAKGRHAFVSNVPVTFTAMGGYEIVGPATAASEAGIASVLVRVVKPGGRVTATGDGLK